MVLAAYQGGSNLHAGWHREAPNPQGITTFALMPLTNTTQMRISKIQLSFPVGQFGENAGTGGRFRLATLVSILWGIGGW
jgi:hypothetical protein